MNPTIDTNLKSLRKTCFLPILVMSWASLSVPISLEGILSPSPGTSSMESLLMGLVGEAMIGVWVGGKTEQAREKRATQEGRPYWTMEREEGI